MVTIIGDTALGRLASLASGGRTFRDGESFNVSKSHAYTVEYVASTSASSRDPAADQEKGSDLQLVEWFENDPEYPRNWSTPYKIFVTAQICFLTTSVYIGSAIYTAGLQSVMRQFGVSEVVALLGLTLFVLGYAIGPMIFSPMSEMPFFGRTPIYIVTLLAFVCLQLAVIYAQNVGMLLAFRFITGFFGSPVLATGGATIADIYAPRKQVYGIAIWGIAAVCGPALGPLVGGFAAENEGWRWTIWELMWLSGACLVFLIVFLPETSSANILYRRTVRYRKITGNTKFKCQPEIDAEGVTGGQIVRMIFIRPFTLGFTEPICFFLNLYIALIYALLYLWFESFPLVFTGIYHFSPGLSGLAFLGILLGAFATIGPFFWYIHKYMEPLFNKNGEIKPEYRVTFKQVPLELPKPGQLLAKVLACGVCHSDSAVQFGIFGNSFPIIPGHEVIGEVVAVGEGEKSFKIGDRVGGPWHGGHDNTCKQCKQGLFQMCDNEAINGVTRDGGYGEYVTLRSEAAVRIPKDVDPAAYCPLLCAGVTVFNSLRKQNIVPGSIVAVQGLGGLGHLALQYTSKMGYRTVAISSSADKKDFAMKLGAHDYIDASKGDIGEQLQKLGGASCIIFTAPNQKLIPSLLQGLAPLGKLLILAASAPAEVNTASMIAKGLSIVAWPSGHALDSEDAIEFAQVHGVNCMIEKFPLDKANDALEHMVSGKVRFRGVLIP